MRSALVVCALAGCKFQAPAASSDAELEIDAAPGVDVPLTDDGMMIDGPPLSPCMVPDSTGLIACYQLDDNLGGGAFVDSSGNGHDATESGFTAVTRPVPGPSQAIVIGSASSALAPQTAAFELTGDLTISAWVFPTNPPSNANSGVIDHDNQWAMSILNGKLSCWFQRQGQLTIADTTSFTNNSWQLIACTLTGNQGCVYRITPAGAVVKNCVAVNTAAAPGQNGISLGSFQNGSGAPEERWSGAVDDIRVYKRALGDPELCTLAGRTSCP